jgi:hypothetical protein
MFVYLRLSNNLFALFGKLSSFMGISYPNLPNLISFPESLAPTKPSPLASNSLSFASNRSSLPAKYHTTFFRASVGAHSYNIFWAESGV